MSSQLVYQMHMPVCSNCSRQMRHLYEDHQELTKQLLDELKDRDVPNGTYIGTISGIDITNYLQTYYQWKVSNPDAIEFQPINVVARGLLAIKPLDNTQLPFGTKRESDGQRDFFTEGMCCLRTLMCDPAFSQ